MARVGGNWRAAREWMVAGIAEIEGLGGETLLPNQRDEAAAFEQAQTYGAARVLPRKMQDLRLRVSYRKYKPAAGC